MSGPAARVLAQAKINLHLRVLAREESGYHSLETIFHRIDLADELVVRVTDGERSIEVEGADAGPAASNLAYRAATAYAAATGWPHGFRIELTKRIPIGAGFGGGSADAAAVLRTLDWLAPTAIGSQALMRIACQIGSDIPFLTSDAVMALAWGRGERMMAMPPLPRQDLLLTTPDFRVSSADAYRWLDEDRQIARGGGAEAAKPSADAAFTITLGDLTDWDALARFARNDFEAPIVARYPKLGEQLARLRESRARNVQMTGSGSAIYSVLDSPPNYSRVPPEQRHRMTTTTTSIDVVQPLRVG